MATPAAIPRSTSELVGNGRDDLASRSPFLQACRGRVPQRHPVWFMRQAGRILEPYRRLKEKTGSILTLFQTPDLAAEITLMPVEMLHVDAAILFADILTPVDPMGCPVSFQPGPVMPPIRTRGDVEALRVSDSEVDLSLHCQRTYLSSALPGRRSRWRPISPREGRARSSPAFGACSGPIPIQLTCCCPSLRT